MPKTLKPEPASSGNTSANALPLQTRAASVSTVNEEARTVDLVWTTGASVRRYDWSRGTYYDEQLVVTPDACDLSRLNGGAPLLNQHSQGSLNAVLGVVERAWIEGGEGKATVRFAKAEEHPDAERIFRMILDKIIRNVSVGYSVQKIERDVSETPGVVPIYRVVRWQPSEISIVAIGADAKAGIRGDEAAQSFPYTLVERAAPATQESNMDEDENVNGAPAAPAAEIRNAPAAPVAPAAPAAPAEHAWRATDIARITARAEAFGLTATDALAVMGEVRSVEAATDALQTRAAAANTPRQTPQARIITDEGDTLRAAVENAILHRAAPGAVQLTDAGRQFRAMSLMEVGAEFIEQQGGNLRGLGKMERASVLLGMTRAPGMHSTSDFSNVLANIASKRMRDAYGNVRQTWKPFCRQSNLPDFKERAIVALSGAIDLKKLREGEEYQFSKLGDSVSKYSLATYGGKFAINRQALINDDLGAFDRVPQHFGRSAANRENQLVWDTLIANQVMSDGKALFHADHKNLGTAASPDEASVGALEEQMGAQLDAGGNPLNLRPAFLVVSRKHKNAALKLMRSITAGKTTDVNVYENSMDVIVEDRLYKSGAGDASPWFIIGDPAEFDTIEYAYLEGEQGLYIESRLGFDIDGIEIKGRLDFAASAIDHRAFQKNPGN